MHSLGPTDLTFQDPTSHSLTAVHAASDDWISGCGCPEVQGDSLLLAFLAVDILKLDRAGGVVRTIDAHISTSLS